VVTVDDSTGFLGGCKVEYALATGIIERNTVATVNSGTQLTLTTNIGTGGIANDALIAVVPAGYYNGKQGVFNVLDYGADGTGSADSTAAINAAITAAAAIGGEVYLPSGNYKTTAELTLVSNVTLRGALGDGSKATVIKPSARTFAAITITGGQIYWRIADVVIDYVSEANSTNTAIGIKGIDSGGNTLPYCFTIERVKVMNAYRGMQFANGCFMYSIRNCSITSCYDYGIYLEGGTTTTLENVYVQTGGGGFFISSVNGLSIINCASDGITTSTHHANHFGSCTGQITSFFSESCNLSGVGFSLFYFGNCKMFAHSIINGANTYSATTNYSSVVLVADSNPRMVFMNCSSSADTVSSGDHYTVVCSGGYSWFFGCNWGEPAGMSAKYLFPSGTQAYVWDKALVSGVFQTFTNNDTTPDVSGGNLFVTANTEATILSNLDGGMEGQTVKIIFKDSNTTVQFFGAYFRGNGGIDWTPDNGDWLEATKYNTLWYCSVHDCTA
jgi:hypothetical protein